MPILNRIYLMLLVLFMFLFNGTYSYAACTIKLKDGRTIKSESIVNSGDSATPSATTENISLYSQ
jgi:hypothetical protein